MSRLQEVQRRLSTQTFSSQNVVNCLYAVARIVTSPSAADLLLLPRHRPELEAVRARHASHNVVRVSSVCCSEPCGGETSVAQNCAHAVAPIATHHLR